MEPFDRGECRIHKAEEVHSRGVCGWDECGEIGPEGRWTLGATSKTFRWWLGGRHEGEAAIGEIGFLESE